MLVSAASIWELAIKEEQGRLRVPPDFLPLIGETGFGALPITLEHGAEAARLPPHHRDPFDRMLVAQARLEGLTLVTADAGLGAYDVRILPVARP